MTYLACSLRPFPVRLLSKAMLRPLVLALLMLVGWSIGPQPGSAYGSPASEPNDAAVNLSFQPASRTVNVGDIFPLEVRLDAGTASFDTVSLDIRFDPSTLVVVDTSGNPVSMVERGNLSSQGNTFVADNAVDNATGKITYTEGYSGRTQMGGLFNVAALRFKAKQPAPNTAVSFANPGSASSPTFTAVLRAGAVVPFGVNPPSPASMAVPAACATLSLQPPSRTVNINTVFTLDVRLEAGQASFDTATLDLRFNPNLLVVVDNAGNPVIRIEQGNLSSQGSTYVVSNTVDNAAGRISYSEGFVGRVQTGGAFTVATIRLKARQATANTPVSFENVGAMTSSSFTGLLQAGVLVPFCIGPVGTDIQVPLLPTSTPTPTATATPNARATPTPTRTPTPLPVANVFIGPSSVSLPVNTSTTVQVRVYNVFNLQSADIRLSFNPRIVMVEDTDSVRDGIQISPGDCFPYGSLVAPTVQADNTPGNHHLGWHARWLLFHR